MRRLFCLTAPLLLLAACVGGGPRPLLREPSDSLDAMRAAFDRDDSSLFIHTLSAPVLKRYSEYVIRLGWGEIRPRIGAMVKRAKFVSIADYRTPDPVPGVGGDFVWPKSGLDARRVRLAVDDDWEDFLFVREVDPPPEDAAQSKGFWVGDRYFVRREHDSPQTYLTQDVPEKDRTHWRLVFPFFPFQRHGKLGRLLQDEMSRERKAPEAEKR